MMKIKAILTLALIFVSGYLAAQYFVTPMDATTIGMSKSNRVTTNDGKVYEGKVTIATYVGANLGGFTLKTESGEKVKLKADQVKLLESEPGKLQKFDMATSGSTVFQAVTKDYSYIDNLKYVNFEPVNYKEKVRLMQLLNPGFDQNFKVYLDPNAKENRWTGQANSYYLVKGDKAYLLKKKDYEETFWELFGDCPKMKEVMTGEVKFYEMAGHIALYNENCPK